MKGPKARGAGISAIFGDDDDVEGAPPPAAAASSEPVQVGRAPARDRAAKSAPRPPAAPPEPSPPEKPTARRDSHPGKKPVLIHIPADMHRTLRQLSVMDDGEPITKVVERGLAEYLAKKGHTKWVR